MGYPLRHNTASQEIPLGPFLDDVDFKTAKTALVIANTNIRLTKGGGTTHVVKNAGGATHDSLGVYFTVLDDTDTNTLGGLVINVSVAGALPVGQQCEVMSAASYDFLYGTAFPAATNHITHPSFELGAADALATGWTAAGNRTGTPVYSKPAGRLGGVAQRVQYTGVAGDAAGNMTLNISATMSAVGSFAPGEPAVHSFWAKGTTTGVSAYALLYASTAAGANIAYVMSTAFTLTADWQRYSVVFASLPANTSRVQGYVFFSSIGDLDTIDITVDDANIIKSGTLSPYLDGTTPTTVLDQYAWTGTDHASTSTRSAASLMPVNATALGNTVQTGRDIGASVLLAADQAVNVTKVGGTVQTAGDLAAAVNTRLATAGYTAPDNAGIASVKAKTDLLPAAPANQVTLSLVEDILRNRQVVTDNLNGTKTVRVYNDAGDAVILTWVWTEVTATRERAT